MILIVKKRFYRNFQISDSLLPIAVPIIYTDKFYYEFI